MEKKKTRKPLFCEQIKEREYILCSAIWYKELPLVREDFPSSHLRPFNCDKGIVFCARNHLQCIYQMIAMTGKRKADAGEHVDGFLTNKNRFVEREEAMKIAKNAKQVGKNTYSKTKLYSEDLFK